MGHPHDPPARAAGAPDDDATRPLPPDRTQVATEALHPRSAGLDLLGTRALVDLLIEDHRRVAGAVARSAPALSAFVEATIARVRDGGRLVYVGAGTSGRLGVLDASECPPTFQSAPEQVVGIIAGGDPALRRSSEGAEDDPSGALAEFDRLRLAARDVVLGIAAGGTTPFVLGAIADAARRGCVTGLLTCAPRPAPIGCDHLIVVDTGPELVAGSTRLKAGSATKLALNVVSTALFVALGKVHDGLMVDLRATNDKLVDRAIRLLRTLHPALRREEAQALLRRADGSVKVAAVMRAWDIDAPTARTRLESTGGRLRDALPKR